MKIQKNRGFTLIELMIVVAIIGVLMAVAIPQYQKYVIRTKASQAVHAFRPVQTTVDEYVTLNKALPPVTMFGDLAEATTCSGIVKQVDVPSITAPSTGTGGTTTNGAVVVAVTFYASADTPATNCQNDQISRIPSQLSGRTIVFQGNYIAGSQSIDWAIDLSNTSPGDGYTMVATDYMPSFGNRL